MSSQAACKNKYKTWPALSNLLLVNQIQIHKVNDSCEPVLLTNSLKINIILSRLINVTFCESIFSESKTYSTGSEVWFLQQMTVMSQVHK